VKRALALAVALAGLAGVAQGQGGRHMRLSANPSAVVAAEIAFNRLAQEKGQWTAFRETAAKDAVMFVPQQVNARDWLKGRKDPPKSVTWQPHNIFVSCSGDLGASTGAWQRPDGSVGYFTTIWRRDEKKGTWTWILDHGDTLASPRAAPEMIAARVAKCRRDRPSAPPPGAKPPGKGERPVPPPDESLRWTASVAADGSRTVQVLLWNGAAYETVIDDRVGPQPS
jgi:hypothetical protein